MRSEIFIGIMTEQGKVNKTKVITLSLLVKSGVLWVFCQVA